METFFQLKGAFERTQIVAELKKVPLMLRIYWRGTWEKWHVQHNATGTDPRYAGRISDTSSIARRRGRNCKWDVCDCNASNNSGVPGKVYNYTS
jgi:hypothetical protein